MNAQSMRRETLGLFVDALGFCVETVAAVSAEPSVARPDQAGAVDELRRSLLSLRDAVAHTPALELSCVVADGAERVETTAGTLLASSDDRLVLQAHQLVIASRALKRFASLSH